LRGEVLTVGEGGVPRKSYKLTKLKSIRKSDEFAGGEKLIEGRTRSSLFQGKWGD